MTRALLQVTCPGCDKSLRIPGEWMVAALRCKHCRVNFHVKRRLRATAENQPVRGAGFSRRWAPQTQWWHRALAAAAVLAILAVATSGSYGYLPQLVGNQTRNQEKAGPPATKTPVEAKAPLSSTPDKPERNPEAAPDKPATQTTATTKAKLSTKSAEKGTATAPISKAEKAESRVAPMFTLPTTKLEANALAKRIDREIGKRLEAEKVKPALLADDAEFLRRVYLDITGVIPTADKAAAFLDNKDPHKRAKLIDQLLGDSHFGRHMADIWEDLLVPRSSDNRRLQAEPLRHWLEGEFNANKAWDTMVAQLITASGHQDENGAVTFFLANQSADKITDKVSKMFLGVQLQCAQCHNHPFTSWKQEEYWGMATFFTKVKTDNVKKAAKDAGNPSVTEDGKGRPQKLPESAKTVPAKFLMGEKPQLDKSAPYRPVLAKWLTSAENPFFARAMANRLWSQFFGRGIVNPVDDMHDGNVPSHPELLQEIAGQFAVNGFDVKYLIRAICNSQAYQRTSKQSSTEDDTAALYSHMAIKIVSPEQLFDSLALVLAPAAKEEGKGRGQIKPPVKKGPNPNGRAGFVAFFQAEEGADPTEYQAGIPQVLKLMNDPKIGGNSKLLEELVRTSKSPAQGVEKLYLAALSRRPTGAEYQRLTNYVRAHGAEPRKAYSDILWAVLNSSEFTLNH